MFSGCPRPKKPVSPGHAITVDIRKLQQETDKALDGKQGAAIVIDVRTGRVLAMSNPAWAVGKAFPVGSALKPLAAATALENDVAGPGLMLPCTGITSIHGHEYHCWLHGGHGHLDMVEALAQSCNIYFYTLGARFKGPELLAMAKKFGFGKITGIPLEQQQIKENPGRIPDILTPEIVSRLATGDTPDFRATPLQMAVFAAALANGGHVYKPVRDTSDTVTLSQSAAKETPVVSSNTLDVVRKGMSECVTSSLGTYHTLTNMGYPAAGKTGTARQLTSLRTHAWFIGFTPVDDPEAAVVVFLEQGQGSRDAAPVAKRIMQAWHQCKRF